MENENLEHWKSFDFVCYDSFLKFKAINSKGVLGLSWQQISCFNCIRDTAYYQEFLNKLISCYIFNKIVLFCEQVNSVSNCQISPCIDKFDRKIRDHAEVCTYLIRGGILTICVSRYTIK